MSKSPRFASPADAVALRSAAELIEQRDALDAQIKIIQSDAREKGHEAWKRIKVQYDWGTTQDGEYQWRFWRQISEKTLEDIRSWEETWSKFGCSAPYGMGSEHHANRPKQGMTFWLVYDADGGAMLISTGGGHVVVKSRDGWNHEPVHITAEEKAAVLRGEFPKSLRRRV